MRGNTKISSTGTTVALEAYAAISARAAVACHKVCNRSKNVDKVIEELVSEAIRTADLENPTRVRDMVGCYLDTMSDDTYTHFRNSIRKYVNRIMKNNVRARK